MDHAEAAGRALCDGHGVFGKCADGSFQMAARLFGRLSGQRKLTSFEPREAGSG